jgi:hypothetical protein
MTLQKQIELIQFVYPQVRENEIRQYLSTAYDSFFSETDGLRVWADIDVVTANTLYQLPDYMNKLHSLEVKDGTGRKFNTIFTLRGRTVQFVDRYSTALTTMDGRASVITYYASIIPFLSEDITEEINVTYPEGSDEAAADIFAGAEFMHDGPRALVLRELSARAKDFDLVKYYDAVYREAKLSTIKYGNTHNSRLESNVLVGI